MKSRLIDLTGKQFGKYTVIRRAPDRVHQCKNGRSTHVTAWLCRCSCGFEKVQDSYTLRKERACGCAKCSPTRFHWQGVGEIGKSYWSNICNGARKRDIQMLVTIEYAWELFLKQNRQCALTGVPLIFARCFSGKAGDLQTASLDRIDSSKGYIEGNIHWVHKDVNRMKGGLDQSTFVQWCKRVAERN